MVLRLHPERQNPTKTLRVECNRLVLSVVLRQGGSLTFVSLVSSVPLCPALSRSLALRGSGTEMKMEPRRGQDEAKMKPSPRA